MPTDAALLAEVPLFAFLDEQERSSLAERIDHVKFKKGDMIFNYGDPGDSLYVVCTGEVEMFFKDATGNRVLLETAKAGDFFGEISLLDQGPRNASAVATEDTDMLE